MGNTELIRHLYDEFKKVRGDDFHLQFITIGIQGIQGSKLTLAAEGKFSYDNFKKRYLKPLQEELRQKTNNSKLEIILALQNAATAAKKIPELPSVSRELPFDGHNRSADNLNSQLTFCNYIESEHNKWAITVGKAIGKERNDSYNPFFIWGGVGLGKTHLLHAIGNACKEKNQKILYNKAETFFNNFLKAIKKNNPNQENFRNKYRNIDVLLLDDIHDLQNKNATQAELFHTFEYLYTHGKQLVFTCDRSPQELKNFTERLLSRLKSGTNVSISNPSYEVRLAILRAKVAEQKLNLPRDVLEFLAKNIHDSVRDLDAALKKIRTFREVLGQEINVAMLSREFQEFFSVKQKPLLVRNIQIHIAAHYGVDLADILSKGRQQCIVFPRQIAMYLARELTPLSTPELGKEFKRDHSTIMAGVRKIKKFEQTDQKFAMELNKLRRELQAVC